MFMVAVESPAQVGRISRVLAKRKFRVVELESKSLKPFHMFVERSGDVAKRIAEITSIRGVTGAVVSKPGVVNEYAS